MNYPMPKKMSYPITKEIAKPKKSKYKNEKVTIDNIKFDSIKESKRYLVLKDKQRCGEISDLRLQVKFELQPSYKIGNKTVRAINYIADFTYHDFTDVGKMVVEDVKGMRTEVYKLKKKLFEYKYQIEISEV